MIAAIRIKGIVGIDRDVKENLTRLRLRKKNVCVVLREKPEIIKELKNLENFIAYGKMKKEVFLELIEKRGKLIDKNKKTDKIKMAEEFLSGRIEKKLQDLNIKPFFRLHPPRGGINSKKHFPKGVLGNNKEQINDLIMRML